MPSSARRAWIAGDTGRVSRQPEPDRAEWRDAAAGDVRPTARPGDACRARCLRAFFHGEERQPVLIEAALAHAQFETIHPFLDGMAASGGC
jgi:Fic/DOC family